MRINLFFLLILFFKISYGQFKKITVFDKFNNSSISNAHLTFNDNLSYVTNENGTVLVDNKSKGEFYISHIAYKTYKCSISLVKDTIYLEPKYYDLDEIIVQNKNIQILRPQKSLGNLNPRNYGGGGAPLNEKLIYAIFIPNTDKKEFYINQISLEPTGYRTVDSNGKTLEKLNNHKYSPFKIDVFSVDTTYNIPNKTMLDEPITVKLEVNKKFATATLLEKVLIDEKGFFIIITSFEKSFYEKIGFKSSPAFNSIQANNKKKYLMLTKNTAIENSVWNQDNRNKNYNIVLNFLIQIEQ